MSFSETCLKCGSREVKNENQLFKNGKTHIRVTCLTCFSFMGYRPQNNRQNLKTQLRFCAGLISTMKQFEKMHPEEVLEWIREQAGK